MFKSRSGQGNAIIYCNTLTTENPQFSKLEENVRRKFSQYKIEVDDTGRYENGEVVIDGQIGWPVYQRVCLK